MGLHLIDDLHEFGEHGIVLLIDFGAGGGGLTGFPAAIGDFEELGEFGAECGHVLSCGFIFEREDMTARPISSLEKNFDIHIGVAEVGQDIMLHTLAAVAVENFFEPEVGGGGEEFDVVGGGDAGGVLAGHTKAGEEGVDQGDNHEEGEYSEGGIYAPQGMGE